MRRWLTVALMLLALPIAGMAQQGGSELDRVLPEVNWDGATLTDVLNALHEATGLNFSITGPFAQTPITLRMTNRTVRDILQEIVNQIGAEFGYDIATKTVQIRPRTVAPPTTTPTTPIRTPSPVTGGETQSSNWERLRFRFLDAYTGTMLLGGTLIVPIFSPLSMGAGFGGLGGFGGGFGGLGGLGGFGGLGGLGGGFGGLGGLGGLGGGLGGLGGFGGLGGGLGGFGGLGGGFGGLGGGFGGLGGGFGGFR